MGTLFVPLILSLMGIAIWSWISLPRGMSLPLAMKIGMVFLIVGQVAGAVIILKGITLLVAHNGNVAALYPTINAFKSPHAISLPAVQILVVIGALADRALKNPKTGNWIVIFTSLGILAALVLSFPGVM